MGEFRNQGFFDDKVLAAMLTATPQVAYAEYSARCPVAHNPDGTVTLTRMDDIRYLSQHPSTLGAGHKDPGLGAAKRRLIPLDLDGEEHRQWRNLLDPLFTPKKVAPLEEKIRARANDLLDEFADRAAADVYAAWCEPLPSSIVLSILGLPQEDRPRLLDFMNASLHPDLGTSKEEQLARMKETTTWVYSYLEESIGRREAAGEPGDDFIGWLMTVDVGGTPLTRTQILDVMFLFLLAGLDTVTALLSNSLSYLARNPEQRQLLLDRPQLWTGAVEELLRTETSITLGERRNQEELTLPSGTVLPANTHVNVSWPSANLDPDTFPEPLKVDFERKRNPHVAFATGPHRCLGSHLARLEIRVALEEFHKRIPNYSLAAGTDLEYTHDPRGVRYLPLTW